MVLDEAIQLKEHIEIIYVVDGYEATITTSERSVLVGCGETVLEAIAALEKKLESVDSLQALRNLPTLG